MPFIQTIQLIDVIAQLFLTVVITILIEYTLDICLGFLELPAV
jgi:hypothetical protein